MTGAAFGPIEIYAHCDGCGAEELIYVEGDGDIVDAALPSGWTERNGKTYCPWETTK